MLCTAAPNPQAVTSPKESNRDKKNLTNGLLDGQSRRRPKAISRTQTAWEALIQLSTSSGSPLLTSTERKTMPTRLKEEL